LTNERSELLLTTLPVGRLSVNLAGTSTIPHYADGAGWTTELILVNPANQILSGTVQLLNPAGQPVSFSLNAQPPSSVVEYRIAPRSSQRFAMPGTGSVLRTGSARLVPRELETAPDGIAIFRLRTGGVTITEAGIPAVPGALAIRSIAERSTTVRTGVAVANVSGSAVQVRIELRNADGSASGFSGSINVPAGGHFAAFLEDIAGLEQLSPLFKGMMRINADTPVAGSVFRGRVNERGDFLIAGIPAVDETADIPSSELLFPHLATGGSYDLQMTLFAGRAGRNSTGTVYFFNQAGEPLPISR
jgi:hypothetical protein